MICSKHSLCGDVYFHKGTVRSVKPGTFPDNFAVVFSLLASKLLSSILVSEKGNGNGKGNLIYTR